MGNKRVLLGMSGGVDSSVAAILLKEQGYEVIGITMKLFEGEIEGSCCNLSSAMDAKRVCDYLEIPHYTLNFKKEFKKYVIDDFINSYAECKTPNPCIECNKYLKFGEMYKKAQELECEYIATGHYGKIEYSEEYKQYVLKKSDAIGKDQSYVLYFLNQEQLAHLIFPIGSYEKSNVREIAKANDFINADKKDSQDICFVPDGDYVKVIKLNTNKKIKIGNFVDKDGKVIGKHTGIINYTIGQHRKLGIPLDGKYFVTKIDADKNEVTLGKEEDLFTDEMNVTNVSFISGETPKNDFICKVKTRYRKPEEIAEVKILDDKNVKVIFKEKQRAITRGQAAVFYDGDVVLGGGMIG